MQIKPFYIKLSDGIIIGPNAKSGRQKDTEYMCVGLLNDKIEFINDLGEFDSIEKHFTRFSRFIPDGEAYKVKNVEFNNSENEAKFDKLNKKIEELTGIIASLKKGK